MHKIRAWGGSPQPSLHHLQSETPRGYSTAGLGLSRQLDIPLTIQDTWFLTDTPHAVLVTPNYLPYQPGCPNCPPPTLAWSSYTTPLCQPGCPSLAPHQPGHPQVSQPGHPTQPAVWSFGCPSLTPLPAWWHQETQASCSLCGYSYLGWVNLHTCS